MAKKTRSNFPVSENKATHIFELIHCDLWGPNRTPSSCDAVYFLTIVDDYSRGVWVYLLRAKSEVRKVICSFFAMVERQFDTWVKIVRSDNGTEFTCMSDYLATHGILFQTSCVGTPQQNGRVERKHQHILNVARALMFQANLPLRFWGECILGAVYLMNRTPSGLLGNKTPYEILCGSTPNYDEMRVFGCLCFAHNQRTKGNKFAPRGRKCIFVGYPNGQKGWKLFDLDTEEFFVSRDVTFHEHDFPFAEASTEDIAPLSPPVAVSIDDDNDNDQLNVPGGDGSAAPPIIPGSTGDTPVGDNGVVTSAAEQSTGTGHGPTMDGGSAATDQIFGRGLREKRPSVLLRDFVSHATNSMSPISILPSSSDSLGTPYSLAHFITFEKF
ncbi:DDE-type integrase/transposase/recombinase, partial [Corynebacterium sp. MC-02]|nr:DDE-type integrase/transposase/recombinase [Corynebacterium pseudokroppenstedtii]